MRQVAVLCEGQTEEIMVREFLAPELFERDLWLEPVILKTKTAAGGTGRGGVSRWAKIEKDLRLQLKSTHWAAVTTLLDYYGLPQDSPGMNADIPNKPARERVELIELRIAERLENHRFIPHLVLHETEAWTFAAAEQLGDLLGEPKLARDLTRVADTEGGPEEVNNGPETAPSKRLLKMYPPYNKTFHGPSSVLDLGLPALRDACPHFDAWVGKLISLAE
ncbi:DUF4276 family protein [Streptomyces sp. WMMB303]|uniref:DUF4276 family protein n=1 Tax=Streptomyces sp. WMMB303 TaxID=3034154 RepID=UPI0023EBC24E|nr:DUF4276 family protein [Streptomyces sp. WMMB303]MDF4251134.1 DUF4276 family protein [Streptomyces sp. WMMB303]